jgi:FkbM family methyltransferase
MSNTWQAAKNAAARLGVYQLTRDTINRVFRPERHKAREAFLSFFRTFIPPGALVFDVGAHEGWYADAFLALGARVVAVEPIPELADAIEQRYHSRIAVEKAAVGERVGTATLHVGVQTIYSTVAPTWVDVVHQDGDERWSGRAITVRATTLDELIERHGLPQFAKIDVEGNEPNVLRGLSTPLQCLSFEIQSRAPEFARECVDRLGELGDYEYNISLGIEHRLQADEWFGPQRVGDYADHLQEKGVHAADVYARLRDNARG